MVFHEENILSNDKFFPFWTVLGNVAGNESCVCRQGHGKLWIPQLFTKNDKRNVGATVLAVFSSLQNLIGTHTLGEMGKQAYLNFSTVSLRLAKMLLNLALQRI